MSAPLRACAALLSLASALLAHGPGGETGRVMLLHAGQQASLVQRLRQGLEQEDGGRVQSYHVGLLRLADAAGRRKILAKLDRADLVFVLGGRAIELLQGIEFRAPVIIVGSGESPVTSRARVLRVVRPEAPLHGRAEDLRILRARRAEDLGSDQIRQATVVVVEGKHLDPGLAAIRAARAFRPTKRSE